MTPCDCGACDGRGYVIAPAPRRVARYTVEDGFLERLPDEWTTRGCVVECRHCRGTGRAPELLEAA